MHRSLELCVKADGVAEKADKVVDDENDSNQHGGRHDELISDDTCLWSPSTCSLWVFSLKVREPNTN